MAPAGVRGTDSRQEAVCELLPCGMAGESALAPAPPHTFGRVWHVVGIEKCLLNMVSEQMKGGLVSAKQSLFTV